MSPKAILGRTIRYNALRKGLLGGSGPWLAVFVMLRLGRGIGKVTKRGEPPVVFSEKVPIGTHYQIDHLRPAKRVGRRARRKR